MFFMFALLKGASVMQKRELYDESVKSMRNEIRCLFSQLRAEKTDNRQFPDVVARIEAAADKIEKPPIELTELQAQYNGVPIK